MSKLTNAQFLTLVSKKAPEFKSLASKESEYVFSEAGFQALENLSGTDDAVSRFYNVALLVGLQFVDLTGYRNPLTTMNLIERFNMSMGSYMQRNRVRRIKNVSPAWLGTNGAGLQNGDSIDPFVVRKPEIDQHYYGINWNYQNFITFQDFDLKRGWLSEGGIQEIVSAVYDQIGLDRVETEYAKVFEVLSGALNSQEHPLLDSQQLVLDSWTDAAPSDAEIRELVEMVKNVAEAIEAVPSVDFYNAGGYPNSAPASDMTLLVRLGLKSKIESVMAYVFGPDYLQFPIKVKAVPNFGGLKAQYNGSDLTPVYDKLGVMIGYSTDGTEANIVDPANVTYLDPNADIIGVIIQKGAIFELIQNEMKVRPIFNPRGEYENTFFNQADNGINYNHTRNIVTISKPSV